MKHKSVLLCTILIALALPFSDAAYQLSPVPAEVRSGPELEAPAFERAAPALEPGLKSPAALTYSKLAPPAAPPRLSFRYLRTIGTTGVPYNTGEGGDDYLNNAYGIDFDGDGNLYVAESEGMRVLRYDHIQHADLILGTAGYMSIDDTHFSWPMDVLAEGDGDFWVADETRITHFNSAGVLQRVYPDNTTGGCNPDVDCLVAPVGLASDSVGRLYVSDTERHAVQVFSLPDGDNPVYWATIGVLDEAGSDDGHFSGLGHIDIDDSDNLYVADGENHRVQKCTYSESPYPFPLSTGTELSGSWSCSTFHGTGNAGEGDDELSEPAAVVVHGSTLYILDAGNGRVKSCNLDAVCDSSFITNLENATDMAVDPAGNVFVTSIGNSYVVRRYSSDGTDPVDYAGTYEMPYGTAPDKIFWPNGLAVDRSGQVYVNENSGNRYLKYDSKGTLVGSVGTAGIFKPLDNYFKGNLLGNPGVSASGLLYLPDTKSFCVKIYTTSFVYQNQTIGTCGSPGDNEVLFRNVAGVAVSPLNRNIYVVDAGNNKVKGFTSSLSPLGPLGGPASGYGAGDYEFDGPGGIAIDKNGNIYVADAGNSRVQKYNSSGVYQDTLGTTGNCDGSFDALCGPGSVATDNLNRVYIADTGNCRVQVYDSTGAYVATIGGICDTGDEDLYHYLTGVAVAPNGTVYVADWLNHRIQVFVWSVPFWR